MLRLLFLFLLLVSIGVNGQNFNVYISDAGNFNNPPWQILRTDKNGVNVTVFTKEKLNWPQDILFLEDSNTVLISNLGANSISRHNATTGAYINLFASSIQGPTRMKIGPDSLLYVLQWKGSGKVKRYDLSGRYVDDFTSVGVPQSIGLDWDKQGNLYVSSYNGDLVRKFDTSGADSGLFIDSSLVGPTNIWIEPNGDMLVLDYDGGAVKRFDAQGKYQGVFISGLGKCEGIDRLPNNDWLIGNGSSRSVKLYDTQGKYKKEFVPGSTAGLRTPNAVVLRMVKDTTDTTTNNIVNIKPEEFGLIYPTVGDSFTITNELPNSIMSVMVFDMNGKLVERLSLIEEQITWTGNNLQEGYYVFHFQMKNGSLIKNRIYLRP
ncbi:MAG: hypothetical protein CL840_02465 [Crocinitomicaceae bacterium]|nr:hypothetical protein [Crocinitomicaceae bacterium]